MNDQSVHDLAARMAEAYVQLQACRDTEREKCEELKHFKSETARAEIALLNAREALDKATGVQPGMMGETYVVDAR